MLPSLVLRYQPYITQRTAALRVLLHAPTILRPLTFPVWHTLSTLETLSVLLDNALPLVHYSRLSQHSKHFQLQILRLTLCWWPNMSSTPRPNSVSSLQDNCATHSKTQKVTSPIWVSRKTLSRLFVTTRSMAVITTTKTKMRTTMKVEDWVGPSAVVLIAPRAEWAERVGPCRPPQAKVEEGGGGAAAGVR